MGDFQTSDEGRVENAASYVGGCAAAIITENDFTDTDGRKPELVPRPPVDGARIALRESSHARSGRLLGSPLGGVTCEADADCSGLCWGRFAGGPGVPTWKIGALMPGPGEARADTADIYLHVHTTVGMPSMTAAKNMPTRR
jgi:hypothetical protein